MARTSIPTALALLVFAACSQVTGIGERFHARDAAQVAQDAPDDAPGPPPDAARFSAPQPITALASSAFDGDPTLPADETEIYFKSDRSGGEGGQDIWRASRTTASDPWSAPAPVAQLSSVDSETAPRISPDGLTIWFIRSPMGGGTGSIMTATRTSRVAAWSTPTAVTELSGASYSKLTSTSTNRLVGYVESNLVTGRVHIARTTRATITSPWGTPVDVTELLGAGFCQSPWASADDLAIIFSSDRPGTIGSGDLWLATRATTSEPFGTPVTVSEVNSFDYDADPWISSDLRHIVFTYSGGGNYEIYEARR